MLEHFDKLKSLSVKFEPKVAEKGIAVEPAVVLRSLDSLQLEIRVDSSGYYDYKLVEEILSSWLNVTSLSFHITGHSQALEIASKKFFGPRFPLKKSIPESWRLEEFKLRFASSWSRSDLIVPRKVIPRTAWLTKEALQNLKVLTLNCYARLKTDSFTTIVFSTPHLEHFKSDHCLGGLRPTDLLAVSSWKRLRTCHLRLDLQEEDLASPPSTRKFVQLKIPGFVPHLVKDWREKLDCLELMEVDCRVVIKDKYMARDENSWSPDIYPMIFGSKCDCGVVHFCIDAEDAAAKSLGFLKPDADE